MGSRIAESVLESEFFPTESRYEHEWIEYMCKLRKRDTGVKPQSDMKTELYRYRKIQRTLKKFAIIDRATVREIHNEIES